jgi:predicted N-acetyltransferase YhbS
MPSAKWEGIVPDAFDLRTYRPADFPSLLDLIGNAFGGESPETVRFAVSASNTTTFVAEIGGSVAGVAQAIAFGQTAWLGNVVVSPTYRRRGLGYALTERALHHALEEADTVLLLALGDAQRIYGRLGFVADGLYGTWARRDPPAAPPVPAPAEHPAAAAAAKLASPATGRVMASGGTGEGAAEDRAVAEQCLRLDNAATGEDRRAYLEYFMAVMRIAYADGPAGRDRVAAGYSARLPWGTGGIIAEDPQVAAGLVGDWLQAFPETYLEFPDANEAGCRLASSLRLTRVKENLRMRFGPPVAGFRPQRIYKTLTPAVG